MRVSDNVAASRACAAGAKPARARIPARLAALAASLMLLAGVQPAHAQGAVAPDPASPTRAINPADLGFSYFLGVGGLTARYREDSSLLPVRSRSTTTSPLIITGALYAINRDVLFYLGGETTFAPGSTNETWTATSSSFNGKTLSDLVVQRNGFSVTENSTELVGLYRVSGDWFVAAGPQLRTQTFKRYSFVQGTDKAVALPTDKTVEESTSEVLAQLGIALEPARVRGNQFHYGVRALLGLPMWARTENTEWPGVHFKPNSGYDLALDGRASWAVYENIHAGIWGRMLTSERRRSIDGNLELPQNRLTTTSYGVELLWKL